MPRRKRKTEGSVLCHLQTPKEKKRKTSCSTGKDYRGKERTTVVNLLTSKRGSTWSWPLLRVREKSRDWFPLPSRCPHQGVEKGGDGPLLLTSSAARTQKGATCNSGQKGKKEGAGEVSSIAPAKRGERKQQGGRKRYISRFAGEGKKEKRPPQPAIDYQAPVSGGKRGRGRSGEGPNPTGKEKREKTGR